MTNLGRLTEQDVTFDRPAVAAVVYAPPMFPPRSLFSLSSYRDSLCLALPVFAGSEEAVTRLLSTVREVLDEAEGVRPSPLYAVMPQKQPGFVRPGSGIAPQPMATIIIGATSGIGRELAVQLVRRGESVGLVGRRQQRLEALRAELGERVHWRAADVTDVDLAAKSFDELTTELGRVDRVVLCAVRAT